MSFKKIAAIVLTAGASVAFAGAANAATTGLGTTFQGGVNTSCGITYGAGTGGTTPLSPAAGTLSGTASFVVACNQAAASVALTSTPTTLAAPGFPATNLPATVGSGSAALTIANSVDFTSINPANSSSSTGLSSSNGTFTVTGTVTPVAGVVLPAGVYAIPTTLTLTYQ